MFRTIALVACLAAPVGAQQIEYSFPAQTFTMDPAHSTLVFRVNHLGFSHYTAGFDTLDGMLVLDPDAPESSVLSVTIPLASLDLATPPAGFRDMLLGPDWFDAAAYPQITYVSTAITLTGAKTATVDGDLTLHGVTHPVTLQVTYNGGWGKQPFEPQARAGFSATGTLNRSDFGMVNGLPPEGTDFGVGDQVSFVIETEWMGEPFR